MKGTAIVSILITALVAALIGVSVVIPSVWQVVKDSTDVTSVSNQSSIRVYNATNRTSFQLSNSPVLINDTNYPIAVFRIYAIGNTLTKDVNYTISKNGTVSILNVSSDWNGTINTPNYWQLGVNYTYTGANYLDNPVQRSLIKQIPVIVALILIVAFAGYIAMAVV